MLMFKLVSGAAAVIVLCLASSPSYAIAQDNMKSLKDLAISHCPDLLGMAASVVEVTLASRRIKIPLTEEEVEFVALGVCGVIGYYYKKENTESGSITKPGAVIKPEVLCPHATDLKTLAWCRSKMPPARSSLGHPGISSRQLIEETIQRTKKIRTPEQWVGDCDQRALNLEACLDRGLPH
jgi:hypothetical protein